MGKKKVIFCGTPAIAVPALEALSRVAEIPGVVCQPDRRAGRGMRLSPPAVKRRALEMGLEVFQPEKVRDGTLARWMRMRDADAALVIAYGRILTAETLAAPRLGCVNLHASLLPAYRGAAPIQRVLMDGCEETGVCLMQMDEGMDTGPVLATRRLPIGSNDDAGSLSVRLAELAAEVTRTELPRFLAGELSPQEQPEQGVSYAPPIRKEDTFLDFCRPAVALFHQVRGLSPRPGAVCTFERRGKASRLKILASQVSDIPLRLSPSVVGEEQGRLYVGTGEGLLELQEVQLEGKKPQSGTDLLNGRLLNPGDRLGTLS